MPSGLVARRLGITPRTLGKITGNLYISPPEGGPGTDLGLCVKHGARGLCVPEYVRAQVGNHIYLGLPYSTLSKNEKVTCQCALAAGCCLAAT